jgi:hypothetical protein
MTMEPVYVRNPHPVVAFLVVNAQDVVKVVCPTQAAADYALAEFVEGGRVIEVDLREVMRKNAARQN